MQTHCFRHGFTTLPWGFAYRSMYGLCGVLLWYPCGPFPYKDIGFSMVLPNYWGLPYRPLYGLCWVCLGPLVNLSPYKDIGFSMVLPHYWGPPYRSMYGLCRVCLGILVALSPTKTSVSALFYHIIGASLTDLCMDYVVCCLGPLVALFPYKDIGFSMVLPHWFSWTPLAAH